MVMVMVMVMVSNNDNNRDLLTEVHFLGDQNNLILGERSPPALCPVRILDLNGLESGAREKYYTSFYIKKQQQPIMFYKGIITKSMKLMV